MTDPRHRRDAPSAPNRARPSPDRSAAIPCALGGAAFGFALSLLVGWILDDESKATALWAYGQHLLVLLSAWAGWLIGAGRGRVVSENVECLAIAIVMALILKHFLLEAYKIPTGSMQPTILGNDTTGIFDRVLVNKFAYLISEPERYDVVVFKYPLDRSKNYIKRLIGLPGERVSIYNGNIYVAHRDSSGRFGPDRIARKPRPARDAVLKRLYPSGREGETFESRFEPTRGEWRVEGERVRLEGGSGLRYGHGETIRDRYLDGYDPSWGIPAAPAGKYAVGDLAIAFEAEPEPGCREISITIFAFGREHRASVPVGSGICRLESGHRNGSGDALLPIPAFGDSTVVASTDDVALAEGERTRVAFYHVDQELVLEVDGEEVLTFAYEIDSPLEPTSNALEVDVHGGAATLSDFEVWRDIHYTTTRSVKRSWEVPDEHLFVLGDNTENSSDGRYWAANRVEFPDGTEITVEAGQMRVGEYTDIYGERYRYSLRTQPTVREASDDFSFVPRHLLLGKALAVFWPIYPHFRWKLIR